MRATMAMDANVENDTVKGSGAPKITRDQAKWRIGPSAAPSLRFENGGGVWEPQGQTNDWAVSSCAFGAARNTDGTMGINTQQRKLARSRA